MVRFNFGEDEEEARSGAQVTGCMRWNFLSAAFWLVTILSLLICCHGKERTAKACNNSISFPEGLALTVLIHSDFFSDKYSFSLSDSRILVWTPQHRPAA